VILLRGRIVLDLVDVNQVHSYNLESGLTFELQRS
jgi:hypothetical protein